MNRLVSIILLVTPSFFSIADSNIVNNLSYVGIGYKQARLDAEAMSPYLDGKYVNDEAKTYGGLYVNLGFNVTEQFFVDGYADFVTRFSSEVDTWRAGAGYNILVQDRLSFPVSCGIVNYRADSDYSSSFSENAGYCKAGIRGQVANHWLIDASYQHEAFDVSKDTVNITNVFQFGRVFGLVAGFEFSERKESERSFNLGVQFSM